MDFRSVGETTAMICYLKLSEASIYLCMQLANSLAELFHHVTIGWSNLNIY